MKARNAKKVLKQISRLSMNEGDILVVNLVEAHRKINREHAKLLKEYVEKVTGHKVLVFANGVELQVLEGPK